MIVPDDVERSDCGTCRAPIWWDPAGDEPRWRHTGETATTGHRADPGPRFHDLDRDAFPFTIEVWTRGADRRAAPSWSVTVDGAGSVQVPGFGSGAWIRITYPDDVSIVAPSGADPADF